MINKLRVPCAYQGGKQRISSQVVDIILEYSESDSCFFDLCCGSGAVSIELVNRGIDPSQIFMLDVSSWGAFWSSIGSGTFNMDRFDQFLSKLPTDKRDIKDYMLEFSKQPIGENEAEIYPILQACSFGGKQIWHNNGQWIKACFRDYWEPTATSVRRSPANPMQPSPVELRRRINDLVHGMKGITCFNADIMTILETSMPKNSIVYIDPPYQKTTGYAFNFNIFSFIKKFREVNQSPLFISEGIALNENAILLEFGGAKGGISGSKKGKHQEWLNRF